MISEFICADDFARFQLNFPNFREPKEIGTFSLDGNRKFCNDNRNLRFYCPPKEERFNFDLSAGYKEAIRKGHGNCEKLDSILQYIISDKKNLITFNEDSKTHCLSSHFVCYRGLLTTILCTPYENKDGWIICATKYRGTIYLYAFDTEAELARKSRISEREDLMSYWGYKFEQYVTADTIDGIPNTSEAVNEKEEYCSVCTTKLNEHQIFFGAEVDCVRVERKDSKSTNRYIELKTSREVTSERQDRNFKRFVFSSSPLDRNGRFKLIKWWSQSFLIGIGDIVCGFRDDDGFVDRLHTFSVREIPKIVNNQWNPCVCFNFCDQFLSFVKKCVIEDNPKIVYKFEWSPRQNVRCEKTNEYEILPDWFVKNVFKQ